jgi:hypothetical protein
MNHNISLRVSDVPLDAEALRGSGIRKSKDASENENPSDQYVFAFCPHFAAIHQYRYYVFMTGDDGWQVPRISVSGPGGAENLLK